MSQYPQAPPPGAYIPPNQGPASPQQSQYYQQPQTTSPYEQSGQSYGPPQMSHKNSSTAAIGKMFDQAVTTGKPMLTKLGKNIGKKLGGKPPAQPTPQHLNSYQDYHQAQYQQPNQAQASQFSPSPQQQQWQQPQQTPQPNLSPAPQQSPQPQSNYATPASGHSGQSTYFPPQASPSPSLQAPPQQPNAPGFNGNQTRPGQGVGWNTHRLSSHGQYQQGPAAQGQIQGQFQQVQPQPSQYNAQQSGVTGLSQTPPVQGLSPALPYGSIASPNVLAQPNQLEQQHSVPSTPGLGNAYPADQKVSAPFEQVQSPSSQTPPPQYSAPPPVSAHPNQHQQQWAPPNPQLPTQISSTSPPPPQTLNGQHQAQPIAPGQQNQQWPSTDPMDPQGQQQAHISPSASPPPVHTPGNQYQGQSSAPPQILQQPQAIPSPKTSVPAPQAAPMQFIAELPADMGSLTLTESSQPTAPSSPPQSSPQAYQAYKPPTSGQGQPITIARRAVSTSSLPLADPWRIADPATELPTREFYIIADLLFDALDRRFEPQDTGLLEASKVLEFLKGQGLEQEAIQLFTHNSYSAFAKLWALEGIPHIMVPCQPVLVPIWNFQQQLHSHAMAVPAAFPLTATYPAYMPALNRAGFYKYFFLEVLSEAEWFDKTVLAVCGEAYKPGILNQPDLQKRDRTELPALAARAKAARQVLARVCQEVAAEMQSPSPSQTVSSAGSPQTPGAGSLAELQAANTLHQQKMIREVYREAGTTPSVTAFYSV